MGGSQAGSLGDRGSAFGCECPEGRSGRFLQGGEALAEVGRGAEGFCSLFFSVFLCALF